MNPKVNGPGFEIESHPGETVLDACRRAGVVLPSGCRAGACLKCLMSCTSGRVGPLAHASLGPDVAARGLFLPCRCIPEGDLRMRATEPADLRDLCRIEVADLDDLGTRLLLRPLQPRHFSAGQRLAFLVEPGLRLSGTVVAEPDDDPLVAMRLDAPSATAVRGRVRGLALRLVAVGTSG